MGSLRFALAEAGLRNFRHGLAALSKIGSDILIEALPSQLILRSINSSQSAYISVSFDPIFFHAYDVAGTDVVQAGAALKSVTATLRTQRVRLFVLQLDADEGVLEITLTCENGLKKTFTMGCTSSEILHATVDKTAFPVTLVAETGAFSRLLSTFHSGVDEVTLISQPDSAPGESGVQIQSFIDPRKGQELGDLVTHISVDVQRAFLRYSNTSGYETEITFNVKDFRAMVQLCESVKACALIRFSGPGLPLIVEPCVDQDGSWDGHFQAELVLATLVAGPGEEGPDEQRSEDQGSIRDEADRAAIVGTPPSERGPWSTGIPGVLTSDVGI